MVNNNLNLPPPRPLPKLNTETWGPLENDDVFLLFLLQIIHFLSGIMKLYPYKGLTDKKRKDFWIPFITL